MPSFGKATAVKSGMTIVKGGSLTTFRNLLITDLTLSRRIIS